MKIFLDVGAHIGQTAKIALEEKYAFDKVFCFEPVSDCCRVLEKIKDPRLNVCCFGLWNKNCIKKIYNPNSKSASVYNNRFKSDVNFIRAKFVDTGDWFSKNINDSDIVYLKINCEGAEISILESLISNGEYKKIDVLMVDFDVRKIPSKKHLMDKMKEKIKKLNILKVFFIDEYNLGRGTHGYFTHYWLNHSITNKPEKIITDKTRIELANSFEGIGAEIGVEQGEFSEIICKNKKVNKLFAIDAWKAYNGYRDHTNQKKLNTFFEATKKRLAPYNCEIVRKFSIDAAGDFLDGVLDFVYIDANHDYDHVHEDLTLWSKKVKKGGIVAGHDYVRRKGQKEHYNVINAVDNFIKENGIKRMFIHKGDFPASWSYIKI